MRLFRALKRGVQDFSEDECMTAGAAIAYYTIFSLPPLLVLVFFIASSFGVPEAKIDQLVREQLGLPMAQEIAEQAQPVAGEEEESEETTAASDSESSESAITAGTSLFGSLGWLSKAVGIGLLVFSATGVFGQLQSALNRAWEVEPDPEQGGVLNMVVKRLLSLGMIVVIAFLLLVSLVLSTLVDEIVGMIGNVAPDGTMTAVGMVINASVTWVLATLLFAAMFKVLPDAIMRWKDIWVGAGITAALVVLGKTLLGWYLQNSDLGNGWGSAAASMIATLVWVYYTSLIVLMGAELTQVWAQEFGPGIQPAEGAVRIVEEKRHVRDEAIRTTA